MLPQTNHINSNNQHNTSKKEKQGLFSFFQRFRTKNNTNKYNTSCSSSHSQEGSSLPASPGIKRNNNLLRDEGRWESVESVISSATATSFAYIPRQKLKDLSLSGLFVYPKVINLKHIETDTYRERIALREKVNSNISGNSNNSKQVSLRRKYNLPASIFSSCEEVRKRQHIVASVTADVVKNRKSTSCTYEGKILTIKTQSRYRRANSENTVIGLQKPRCHRPGKRKAPSPPKASLGKINNRKSLTRSLKRKAPSPPNNKYPHDSSKMEKNAVIKPNESLKLENGQLKATHGETKDEKIKTPVSPRFWYKRNSKEKANKCSKNTEKNKSCEELLDQWMLEAGMPRSPSFYEKQQFNFLPDKRKSQISILANISQLDREAAEIIKKEQKKQKQMNLQDDNKFYKKLDSQINSENKRNTLKQDEVKKVVEEKIMENPLDEEPKLKEEKVEVEVEMNKLGNEVVKEISVNGKPFSNWKCSQCTLENPSWKFICEACNKWRPYSANKINKTPESNKAHSTKEVENTSKDSKGKCGDEEKLINEVEKTRQARLEFFDKRKSLDSSSHSKSIEEDQNDLKRLVRQLKHSLTKKEARKDERLVQCGKKKEQVATCSKTVVSLANTGNLELGGSSKSSYEVVKNKFELIEHGVFKSNNFEGHTYCNTPANSHLHKHLSKFDIKGEGSGGKLSPLAVSRLLKKLQVAISTGQHHEAANIARELARLRVNCNVTAQTDNVRITITVHMYVEDKVSHKGPIPLDIHPSMTIAQLKQKVHKDFEIPVQVQRWIVGKQLANNNERTMNDLGVNVHEYPIFLYLVAPEKKQAKETNDVKLRDEENVALNNDELKIEQEDDDVQIIGNDNKIGREEATIIIGADCVEKEQHEQVIGWKCEKCTLINKLKRPGCAACTSPKPIDILDKEQVEKEETIKMDSYQELMDLEKEDLVMNKEEFECSICLTDIEGNTGVTLRDCLHSFCKDCLAGTIEFNEEAQVKCPFRDNEYSCSSYLQEREIRAIVSPQVYQQHLTRSITEAENKIRNAFHCKTADCEGWCIFEDNLNDFFCPVCEKTNCLTCQAIHTGLNCKQYQHLMEQQSETNLDARRTNEMLQEMVEKGDAMRCPTCLVVLMKKWGCDWIRCSMCKTEICWVTRGPRWGPQGKGDTSAGCKCGVKGIKCHPKCNYCH